MARPTWRQLAARGWEFRPGSTGVLVMTIGTVLWAAVTDWPAWVCALGVVLLAAAVAALFAALELSNEASGIDTGEELPTPPAGGTFAVDGEAEDGRRVDLKSEGGEL
jgi:hypothetical protein